MRMLSRLLMILCLVSTLASCRSTQELTPIHIPELSVARPVRPELVEIPQDTSGAIKAMTVNLSLMEAYIYLLEIFIDFQQEYHRSVLGILLDR